MSGTASSCKRLSVGSYQIPEPVGRCLYFFVADGCLAYIGKTENFHERIAKHHKDTQLVEIVYYVKLPQISSSDWRAVERCLIWNFWPPWNAMRPKPGQKNKALFAVNHGNDLVSIIW